MAVPYLRSDILSENMKARPQQAFFVRPEDYRVIDGDTIAILAPAQMDADRSVIDEITHGSQEPQRPVAFRVRLRTVNAPEMPITSAGDDLLRAAGVDPHAGHVAVAAKAALAHMVRGRTLHFDPDGVDSYRRSLCNVTASGKKDDLFHLDGAFSVERRLVDLGLVNVMEGKGWLPARYPDLGQEALPLSTISSPSL